MAPLVGPHNEKYEEFFAKWMKTQEERVKGLEEALESDMKEAELEEEVRKVAEHYEVYYRAKRSASHQDILQIATPSWRSPFEKAFLWLGGWRPSLAFQLVYALAGQQIEAELVEFLDGVDTPSFASFSSLQLSHISELQTSTNKREENLAHDMAVLQQSFADQPLLTLAQAHHMAQAQAADNEPEAKKTHDGAMNAAMEEKLSTLQDIINQADTLRLTTLQNVLDILSVFQKAQYLVAAGKLQFTLHYVGEKLNGQSAP